MSDDLYPKDMLRAASIVTHAGRLETPDGSAALDNPFCGDRVEFDVALDGERRITALRHRVKACVLCQAATNLLAAEAAGLDAGSVAALGDTLLAGLKRGEAPLLPGHPAFDLFTGITRHRTRFSCVLLPFETLEAAARAAAETTP
ncbi:iron-sulfur cluster assembly scaffold protein [Zavarzinia compransoris]|uniref:iron-sulfur cluster assembly scaffold protein n=1 Tax=Zavarzinia compransoris TaxID=1264899 RepID=UPI0010618F80|nr:iron-sulfur cluster assembly scaffold protein [Zavarzinia compransoris]TDP45937.1 modular FeS cluster scaffolding protein NifU [Zavarzinia compransoris]